MEWVRAQEVHATSFNGINAGNVRQGNPPFDVAGIDRSVPCGYFIDLTSRVPDSNTYTNSDEYYPMPSDAPSLHYSDGFAKDTITNKLYAAKAFDVGCNRHFTCVANGLYVEMFDTTPSLPKASSLYPAVRIKLNSPVCSPRHISIFVSRLTEDSITSTSPSDDHPINPLYTKSGVAQSPFIINISFLTASLVLHRIQLLTFACTNFSPVDLKLSFMVLRESLDYISQKYALFDHFTSPQKTTLEPFAASYGYGCILLRPFSVSCMELNGTSENYERSALLRSLLGNVCSKERIRGTAYTEHTAPHFESNSRGSESNIGQSRPLGEREALGSNAFEGLISNEWESRSVDTGELSQETPAPYMAPNELITLSMCHCDAVVLCNTISNFLCICEFPSTKAYGKSDVDTINNKGEHRNAAIRLKYINLNTFEISTRRKQMRFEASDKVYGSHMNTALTDPHEPAIRMSEAGKDNENTAKTLLPRNAEYDGVQEVCSSRSFAEPTVPILRECVSILDRVNDGQKGFNSKFQLYQTPQFHSFYQASITSFISKMVLPGAYRDRVTAQAIVSLPQRVAQLHVSSRVAFNWIDMCNDGMTLTLSKEKQRTLNAWQIKGNSATLLGSLVIESRAKHRHVSRHHQPSLPTIQCSATGKTACIALQDYFYIIDISDISCMQLLCKQSLMADATMSCCSFVITEDVLWVKQANAMLYYPFSDKADSSHRRTSPFSLHTDASSHLRHRTSFAVSDSSFKQKPYGAFPSAVLDLQTIYTERCSLLRKLKLQDLQHIWKEIEAAKLDENQIIEGSNEATSRETNYEWLDGEVNGKWEINLNETNSSTSDNSEDSTMSHTVLEDLQEQDWSLWNSITITAEPNERPAMNENTVASEAAQGTTSESNTIYTSAAPRRLSMKRPYASPFNYEKMQIHRADSALRDSNKFLRTQSGGGSTHYRVAYNISENPFIEAFADAFRTRWAAILDEDECQQVCNFLSFIVHNFLNDFCSSHLPINVLLQALQNTIFSKNMALTCRPTIEQMLVEMVEAVLFEECIEMDSPVDLPQVALNFFQDLSWEIEHSLQQLYSVQYFDASSVWSFSIEANTEKNAISETLQVPNSIPVITSQAGMSLIYGTENILEIIHNTFQFHNIKAKKRSSGQNIDTGRALQTQNLSLDSLSSQIEEYISSLNSMCDHPYWSISLCGWIVSTYLLQYPRTQRYMEWGLNSYLINIFQTYTTATNQIVFKKFVNQSWLHSTSEFDSEHQFVYSSAKAALLKCIGSFSASSGSRIREALQFQLSIYQDVFKSNYKTNLVSAKLMRERDDAPMSLTERVGSLRMSNGFLCDYQTSRSVHFAIFWILEHLNGITGLKETQWSNLRADTVDRDQFWWHMQFGEPITQVGPVGRVVGKCGQLKKNDLNRLSETLNFLNIMVPVMKAISLCLSFAESADKCYPQVTNMICPAFHLDLSYPLVRETFWSDVRKQLHSNALPKIDALGQLLSVLLGYAQSVALSLTAANLSENDDPFITGLSNYLFAFSALHSQKPCFSTIAQALVKCSKVPFFALSIIGDGTQSTGSKSIFSGEIVEEEIAAPSIIGGNALITLPHDAAINTGLGNTVDTSVSYWNGRTSTNSEPSVTEYSYHPRDTSIGGIRELDTNYATYSNNAVALMLLHACECIQRHMQKNSSNGSQFKEEKAAIRRILSHCISFTKSSTELDTFVWSKLLDVARETNAISIGLTALNRSPKSLPIKQQLIALWKASCLKGTLSSFSFADFRRSLTAPLMLFLEAVLFRIVLCGDPLNELTTAAFQSLATDYASFGKFSQYARLAFLFAASIQSRFYAQFPPSRKQLYSSYVNDTLYNLSKDVASSELDCHDFPLWLVKGINCLREASVGSSDYVSDEGRILYRMGTEELEVHKTACLIMTQRQEPIIDPQRYLRLLSELLETALCALSCSRSSSIYIPSTLNHLLLRLDLEEYRLSNFPVVDFENQENFSFSENLSQFAMHTQDMGAFQSAANIRIRGEKWKEWSNRMKEKIITTTLLSRIITVAKARAIVMKAEPNDKLYQGIWVYDPMELVYRLGWLGFIKNAEDLSDACGIDPFYSLNAYLFYLTRMVIPDNTHILRKEFEDGFDDFKSLSYSMWSSYIDAVKRASCNQADQSRLHLKLLEAIFNMIHSHKKSIPQFIVDYFLSHEHYRTDFSPLLKLLMQFDRYDDCVKIVERDLHVGSLRECYKSNWADFCPLSLIIQLLKVLENRKMDKQLQERDRVVADDLWSRLEMKLKAYFKLASQMNEDLSHLYARESHNEMINEINRLKSDSQS